MEILFLIGRILFGGFFIMNGVNHFTKSAMMASYAQSKGVPSPKLSVIVSGLFILFGGLGMVFGVYTQMAIALIVVFLLVISFKMHAFWKIEDAQMKMAEMVNFSKNLALCGAALALLAIPTPWPLNFF